MIYTHIASGMGGAIIAGVLAWSAQGWRLSEQIQAIHAANAKAQAVAETEARAKEASFNKQLQDAQNAAAKREQDLRATVDRSRTQLDGLRSATYQLRAKLPSYSPAATAQAADAAAELLGICAGEYRAVAEAADRHAADSMMLLEAWPK